MLDGTRNGNLTVGFIVGGLVVTTAVLAYFLLGGEAPNQGSEIRIELPNLQIEGN